MINPNAMVFVIDDDESVRKSLRRLLDAAITKQNSSTLLPSFSRVQPIRDLHALLLMCRCPG